MGSGPPTTTTRHSSPWRPLPERPKSIGLGTNIAYAFTRSPMETGLSALDLDALSKGRFSLGPGPGIPHHQRKVVRRPPRPSGAAYERVHSGDQGCDRRGVAGAPGQIPRASIYDIDIEGWSRIQPKPRERIPIYVGAMREGMCRMAGDVADGLMPHSICSAQWIKEVMLPNVNIGLERSGRKREDFDFAACLSVAITEDKEQALHDFKDTIAFSAVTRTYQTIFSWHGFGREAEAIRDMFLEKGYGPEVIETVPDEMVEAFTIIGSVDEVRRRVRRIRRVRGLHTLRTEQLRFRT